MLSCPATPPAITQRAEADIPEIARQMHAEGTAIVKLELDANGKVTKAVIQKSSGNPALDGAAIRAGRDSTFKAATESCKPVASMFLMVVELRG
jgi:periplasmic protein TonB